MRRLLRAEWILLAVALALPLVDLGLEAAGLSGWRLGNEVAQRVIVFAIMGLGLNIVVGYTGLLHLGVAAFMAIGVYSYAILTADVYPYQIGFWPALIAAPVLCAAAGLLLGAPTLRLRGDYLAIVTLGFGEIAQDILKNVESVTKGTQGITALPPPSVGIPSSPWVYEFSTSADAPWYYLYLAILVALIVLVRNLENSRLGRQWMSIREDELAATCMGINPTKTKLMAFAIGAALCGIAGVLYASKFATTAEPATYDFNVSITVLAIAIVGGLGSIRGVLAGTLIIMGVDILLRKVTDLFSITGGTVFLQPSNWKYLLFGLALVLMMRFRPEGFFPSSRIKEEMHEETSDGALTRVGVE